MSINFKTKCQKIYNDQGKHECNVEKHYCHKVCYLKHLTREGYMGEWILDAGHDGECICLIDRANHICNGICNIHNLRGCKKDCVLSTNHEEDHLSKTPKEGHLCSNECILKDSIIILWTNTRYSSK